MKKRFFLFICFSIIFALSCDSKQKETTITSDEFKEIIVKFHTYFDAKDFRSISKMCSDDMFWYTLNGKALKKNEMAGFFMPMMSNWKTVNTSISNIEYNVSNKLAVARYKTKIDILTATGGTSMNNLHTMIINYSGTEWQVWQHHMSRKD